jgi:hypothetical protein
MGGVGRSTVDIDILVQGAQLNRVDSIMSDLGYKCAYLLEKENIDWQLVESYLKYSKWKIYSGK